MLMVVGLLPFITGINLTPGFNSEVVAANVLPAGAAAFALYDTQISAPGVNENATTHLVLIPVGVGHVTVALPAAAIVALSIFVETGGAKALYPCASLPKLNVVVINNFLII
jgi:hypothetical protein